MTLRVMCALLIVLTSAPAALVTDIQQKRDVAPPTTGTASISGTVMDDDQPARPVRRAVVTLSGTGLHPNRGAITDDDGRFTLRNLPAGRFMLAAERGAYVSSIYGAKRPARAGTLITLADGQRVTDLVVRLWRGAVLAGVLRDEWGEPLRNIPVAAIAARDVTPAALTLSNRNTARTNDLGEFRIFGLEPGTYVLRAGNIAIGVGARGEIAASEAEVDAKLAALAARAKRPGATGESARIATAAPTLVNPAPIYFPGTPAATEATPIAIKAGEERRGLDFVFRRVATSMIRGTVVGPDGAPIPRAYLRLAGVAAAVEIAGATSAPVIFTAGSDGAFALGPISPGTYTLLARGSLSSAKGAGGDASGPFWWALVPVSVSISGGDIDLSGVTLQRGMTFSGRVVFEGATAPAPDATSLRVQLQSDALAQMPSQGRGGAGPPGMRFLQPAAVGADGTFQLTDLIPDEYRLAVSGGAVDNSTWWLRSAMWNGRDLLDAPLRLAPGDERSGITIVLSRRRTQLSGTIATPAGAAATDLFVIAFPADPALRTPRSRRIQAVRPDSAGRYVLANLPSGEYLLCGLADIDEGQWNDPGFLDALVGASARITLGEGEQKVLDLRAGG